MGVKEVYFLCPVCKKLVPLEDVDYREVVTQVDYFSVSLNEYGEIEYDVTDTDVIELLEKYVVHKGHEVTIPLGVDFEEYLVFIYDDGSIKVGNAVKNIFDKKLLNNV